MEEGGLVSRVRPTDSGPPVTRPLPIYLRTQSPPRRERPRRKILTETNLVARNCEMGVKQPGVVQCCLPCPSYVPPPCFCAPLCDLDSEIPKMQCFGDRHWPCNCNSDPSCRRDDRGVVIGFTSGMHLGLCHRPFRSFAFLACFSAAMFLFLSLSHGGIGSTSCLLHRASSTSRLRCD